MEPQKPSASTAIRNLMVILATAVLSAVALVVALVVYYGPSGSYRAENVLVAPEVLSKISYEQATPNTGKLQRFEYDHLEFTYFSPKQGDRASVKLDQGQYQSIYALLSGDRSISSVPVEVEQLFNGPRVASLTLWARPEGTQGPARVFYRVYFPSLGGM